MEIPHKIIEKEQALEILTARDALQKQLDIEAQILFSTWSILIRQDRRLKQQGASHVGISINIYEALWSKKGKIEQKLTEEMTMIQLSAEKQQELDEHILAISRILYEHTEVENLKTFETIEWEVREQMLEKITPKIGEFFFQKGEKKGRGSKEG